MIQDRHTETLCWLCLPTLGPWPLSAGGRPLPWSHVCRQCPSLQPCAGTLRWGTQPREWAGTAVTPVPAAAGSPAARTRRLVTALPGAGRAVLRASGCVFLTANVRGETQPCRSCQKICSPPRQALGTHWSLSCCQQTTFAAWTMVRLPGTGGMSVSGVHAWEQHPGKTGLCCGAGPRRAAALPACPQPRPGRHPMKLRTPPGPYAVDFHLAAFPPGKLAAEPVEHRPALPARCPQV